MYSSRCVLLVALGLVPALGELSVAQTASPQKIPTGLGCWQVSSDGKRTPTFVDKFELSVSNGALTGARPTRVQKGSDQYRGSVDPTGKITMSSKGHFDDKSQEWTSYFAGELKEKGPTVLYGAIKIAGKTPIVHKCAITFLVAPADLAKILSAKEAAAQPKPQ